MPGVLDASTPPRRRRHCQSETKRRLQNKRAQRAQPKHNSRDRRSRDKLLGISNYARGVCGTLVCNLKATLTLIRLLPTRVLFRPARYNILAVQVQDRGAVVGVKLVGL